jgi:hypothetical protein
MRDRLLQNGMSALPRSWRRKWMTQRILATPPWADFGEIKKIYSEAKRMTLLTGINYTVGHIVPLNHPMVNGLHVAWNLQLEPASANFIKGNKFYPDQLDMFTQPQQLTL